MVEKTIFSGHRGPWLNEWVMALLIFGNWPFPSGWHVSERLLSGKDLFIQWKGEVTGGPHPSYTHNAETFPTRARCQSLARGGVHQPKWTRRLVSWRKLNSRSVRSELKTVSGSLAWTRKIADAQNFWKNEKVVGHLNQPESQLKKKKKSLNMT